MECDYSTDFMLTPVDVDHGGFVTDEGTMFITPDDYVQAQQINELRDDVHKLNSQWWRDLQTGAPIERNVGELVMLMVCELAEGIEGHRKSLQDDHLPNRPMIEVELADAVIRILDFAGGFKLDIGGALVEKLRYNSIRADHKAAARLADNGKKY
jgi:hypothetical protein